MPPKQHQWGADTYQDLLLALNDYYKPNALDCRNMIAGLKAKGYEFSDNALLYGHLVFVVCTSSTYHFLFLPPRSHSSSLSTKQHSISTTQPQPPTDAQR